MELRLQFVASIFIIIGLGIVRSQEVPTPVTNPTQPSVSIVPQAVTEAAPILPTESSAVPLGAITVNTLLTTLVVTVPPAVRVEQNKPANSTINTTTASILTTFSNSSVNSSNTPPTSDSSGVSQTISSVNTTVITEKIKDEATAVTVTTIINNVTADIKNNTNNNQNVNATENETKESTTNPSVTSVINNDTSAVINDINANQSVAANDDNLKESTTTHSLLTGPMDIQTQLYIISGTFGAVVFLLILLVLTLALSVAKIKDQLCDSEARYIPGKEQIHGYQNGAFNGGGDVVRGVNERSVDKDNHNDLKDLGYTIYNGKGQSRENVYKVSDPVNNSGGENIPLDNVSSYGRGQMMKYEEGVIPMADEEHVRNYR